MCREGCSGVDDVERAHQLVVLRVMLFACVIGSIEDAFTPEMELALGISALEPMKTLIHRFGGLGCHSAHGEPESCDVVGGDRGGLGLVVT